MDDVNAVPMEGEFTVIAVGGEVLLEIIAVRLDISAGINKSMSGNDNKSVVVEGGAISVVLRAIP